MEETPKILAYNVRTKEKNVEMKDVVITKTSRGAFMARGLDAKTGDKLTTLMGQDKAYAAIRAGIATAEGFEVPAEEAKTESNEG